MKRKFFFNLLLIVVGILIFGGCSQNDDNDSLATGDPVEIRFTVDGVSDYEGDTSAETRSPAAPFTVSVPVDDNYEIEATFTPRKTEQTRASGSTLAENTRYRVLAYKDGGSTYEGYADYKIENGKSVLMNSGLGLLAGGRYKFIAYSYNNSNTITEVPDGNTGIGMKFLTVSTNDDFLYWQSGLVEVSRDMLLTINFRHLFSQLQVVFDITEFGVGCKFVSAATDLTIGGKAPYTSGTWSFGDEYVSINALSTQNGSFSFPSISGQVITSEARRLLPVSNTVSTPLQFSIGAEFSTGIKINGSSDGITFAIPGNQLRPNTAYTCTIKFRTLSVYMDKEGDETNKYPYGGGNCWVVPKNKTRDITYIFTALEGRSNDPVGTTVGDSPSSAKLVWQIDDNGNNCNNLIKSVSYSSGQMRFTVGSGQTGNAIIAVTSISGTILWSWHIWVVSDNSFLLKPKSISGVYLGTGFMDRNLGAADAVGPTSYGLFYQWGRKDPLRRESDHTAPGQVSALTAIRNPDKFYTVTGSYHWCADANKTELWSDTSTDAAMLKYNPCPRGWTLPTRNIYDTSKVKGKIQDNTYVLPCTDFSELFFVPAGDRYDYDGSLRYVGTNGNYWSSTTAGGMTAYKLSFSTSVSVVPDKCGEGLSIRCVRE